MFIRDKWYKPKTIVEIIFFLVYDIASIFKTIS